MKIVVTECSWKSYDVEKQYLPGDAEVVCAKAMTEDEVIALCHDADAALAEYAPFTRKVLEACPKLKIISQSAMGVDNIDLDACRELGIAVANVPRYCIPEVAEHIAALVLGLLRWIPGYDNSVRVQHRWDFDVAPKLYRIEGMSVGLVGCGRIPQHALKLLSGFNFKVYGYDPYLPKEVADAAGIELVPDITDLGRVSDIIISHIPGLKGTEKMVNRTLFDACERHPIFINCARGASVNYDDLADALKSGKLSAAGLDVVDAEPADFNSAIFGCDNVIITPHAAFYSETALVECRRDSALNVVNFLTGDKSKVYYVVNPTEK